jgi:hypothetical protein
MTCEDQLDETGKGFCGWEPLVGDFFLVKGRSGAQFQRLMVKKRNVVFDQR